MLEGPLESVYVYEAPVRIWHWVMMVCMIVLAVTGYLIGSPPPAIGGEPWDTYFFAWIRMIHFIAAWVFIVAFAVRIYWAFAGNHHARSIFLPPFFSGAWWRGLFSQMRYYLFLKPESDLWVGHNPLAQAAMFFMFTLGTLFMIVTGLRALFRAMGLGPGADAAVRLGVRACSATRRWCARCITSGCGTCCCSRSSTCTWCSARTS